MKKTLRSALLAAVFGGFSTPVLADAPNVVVTIKPVHSLAAAIMDGVGSPELLITGAASPHDFSLKPSQARSLQDADLVIWIGEDLESFMPDALSSLAKKATQLELLETEGLHLLKNREAGLNDGHDDHDDHAGHKDHDDHKGHDDHKDHDHDEHDHQDAHAEHKDHADHDDHKGHDHHDDHKDHDDHKGHDDHAEEDGHDGHHHHGEHDPHIWLDTHNAEVMAGAIAAALGKADPANKATYQANLAKLEARLEDLEKAIREQTKPLHEKQFITFHDAFQYFEHQFALETAGTLTINPAIKPGAARIQEIRHELEEGKIRCLFAEPQFPVRIFNALTDGLDVKTGRLDPLGAALDAGPDMYVTHLRMMASDMTACLR